MGISYTVLCHNVWGSRLRTLSSLSTSTLDRPAGIACCVHCVSSALYSTSCVQCVQSAPSTLKIEPVELPAINGVCGWGVISTQGCCQVRVTVSAVNALGDANFQCWFTLLLHEAWSCTRPDLSHSAYTVTMLK